MGKKMENNKDVNATSKLEKMLKDIDEVKALFIFGEKVIPVLQDLFVFLAEIIPVLTEMRNSLASSYKEMPQIMNKLDNITEETELATNQIMDTIDIISAKVGENQEIIQEISDLSNTNIQHGKEVFDKSLEIFHLNKEIIDKIKKREPLKLSKYEKQNNAIMMNLKELLKTHLENIKDMASKTDKISKENFDISNSVFAIMNALQFQDITTQQIRHANNVISMIEHKLVKLLNKFENTTINTGNFKGIHEGTFDPNATYKNAKKRQNVADDLFTSDDDDDEFVSQDEIDNLMNNEVSNEVVDQDEIDKLMNHEIIEKSGVNEVIDQDEIDKLLNQTAPAQPVEEEKKDETDSTAISQDEIDKLLNGEL